MSLKAFLMYTNQKQLIVSVWIEVSCSFFFFFFIVCFFSFNFVAERHSTFFSGQLKYWSVYRYIKYSENLEQLYVNIWTQLLPWVKLKHVSPRVWSLTLFRSLSENVTSSTKISLIISIIRHKLSRTLLPPALPPNCGSNVVQEVCSIPS